MVITLVTNVVLRVVTMFVALPVLVIVGRDGPRRGLAASKGNDHSSIGEANLHLAACALESEWANVLKTGHLLSLRLLLDTYIHTYRHAYMRVDRQAGRQAGRQTSMWAGIHVLDGPT